MRKTPLRRKTPMKKGKPLKRGPSTLKKTKLKSTSKKKDKWLKLYEQSKKDNPPPADGMEPHHVYGRIGNRILCFCWVARQFHAWLHDHGQEARVMGWIQPQFDGRENPLVPKPWSHHQQKHWPKEYQKP